MFGEYDFHLLQIQYLKAAMDQVAAFRPQNMTPAQMQTEYDNGVTTRTNFQTKAAARNLARGEMYEKQADGHQAAVGVYAVMKSRYRKDQGSAEAIGKLPTQDRTVDDSITRMEAMTTLWGQLPNDPFSNPAGPFVAWTGMDKAAFDVKLATLKPTNPPSSPPTKATRSRRATCTPRTVSWPIWRWRRWPKVEGSLPRARPSARSSTPSPPNPRSNHPRRP